jgi:tetratricopeptide (TPR) repeat protein
LNPPEPEAAEGEQAHQPAAVPGPEAQPTEIPGVENPIIAAAQAPTQAAIPEAAEAQSPEVQAPEAQAPDTPAGEGAPSTKQANPRPWADLLMGVIHFEEGNMEEALASLLKAEQSDPRLPNLHLRIGETYLRQKRTDDADRAFQQALDIDGDSPEAHLGLAMVRLRQRRNEEAAEQALLAVGLQHFLPLGHFYLGVALARLGHRQRAMLAFETCLSMLPGLVAAHRWLAALHSQPGGDLDKAVRHRSLYAQLMHQRKTRAQA